jgi:Mn2+/Fe2+ NRAMP family transporter
VLIALILQYSPINPMKALFWSAVINGVVAVPLLVLIVLLASSTKVMGRYTIGPITKALGWLTVAIMGVAAVAMWVL